MKSKNDERLWTLWDGIEAFGAYYSAMFQQWRSQQPLGSAESKSGLSGITTTAHNVVIAYLQPNSLL